MEITKLISLLLIAAMIAEPFYLRRQKIKRNNKYWSDYLSVNNDLPHHVNWKETNEFLADTNFGSNMPDRFWFYLDWPKQPCVKEALDAAKLSKRSLQVLETLSKDMRRFWHDVHFYYDHGPVAEDREAKYSRLKNALETKYGGLSENIRNVIYDHFVYMYERVKSA